MPLSAPEALGLAVLKVMFETDLERGVDMLLRMALPALENSSVERRQIEVADDDR